MSMDLCIKCKSLPFVTSNLCSPLDVSGHLLQLLLQLVRTEEASWMRDETDTSPVASDMAIKMTMTWMTDNLHQFITD